MDILGVEKLTNERWLNLYAAQFRHNDHQGRWVYASRKKRAEDAPRPADAVVMVPILHEAGHEPRLVMLREFRVPVGGWIYAFPAGLLEDGEPVEETARRELREETGFEVTRIKRVSPSLLSSAGVTDEAAVLVFVDAYAPKGAQTKHEAGEEIEVLLLTHADACRLCDEPTVRIDAKAWGVLYMYQQLGRFV